MRTITNNKKPYITKTLAVFIIGLLAINWVYNNSLEQAEASSYSLQDQIRLDRIRGCIEGYKANKERVDEIYLHTKQNKIARCATYATLVYAKESWWGKSDRCLTRYNCFWIRNSTHQSGVSYKLDYNNFKIYRNYEDANTDFGHLYFKWHFNRSWYDFVRVWSETDQQTYTSFINDNYNEVYKEILTLISL